MVHRLEIDGKFVYFTPTPQPGRLFLLYAIFGNQRGWMWERLSQFPCQLPRSKLQRMSEWGRTQQDILRRFTGSESVCWWRFLTHDGWKTCDRWQRRCQNKRQWGFRAFGDKGVAEFIRHVLPPAAPPRKSPAASFVCERHREQILFTEAAIFSTVAQTGQT